MNLRAMLSILAQDRCTFEETIAALCVLATVAHAQGDFRRRDDAVDLAAELAVGLADESN